MCLGIGGIAELLGHEVIGVVRYYFVGFVDGALHEFQAMREDHARTVSAQESHAFDVDIIGHRKDCFIAFGGAHHCQTDSRISACRFDDCPSRFQTAFTLCSLDHAQSDAVFNTTARVQRLELHQHFGPIVPGNAFQSDNRCTANNVADAVIDPVVHMLNSYAGITRSNSFFVKIRASLKKWC